MCIHLWTAWAVVTLLGNPLGEYNRGFVQVIEQRQCETCKKKQSRTKCEYLNYDNEKASNS